VAGSSSYILLGYQRRFVSDPARFRIWVASRQIGKSFALSADGAFKSQDGKRDILFVSASQRQSKGLMRKFYQHLRALGALTGAARLAARENREECELANGNTVLSLPASPETVRGFSGDVYLDEFAMHRDSRAIWAALYPSITRGFSICVASTPMGKQGKFWDLWSRNDTFAKHRTTIHDAVADGLPIDVAELRAGLDDPDTWAQEYECEFVDEATAFLTHELITSCEFDPDLATPLLAWDDDEFVGVDIGRKKDLTVIWRLQRRAGVLWTIAVIALAKKKFADQKDVLWPILERCRRACIDATGLGMQLAEEAAEAFGSKIEPVTFTGAVKEALAYGLRTAMEDRLVRLPTDRVIHNDLHSVKKITTAAGNIRFDVEASESAGHADHFWALALATEAASQPTAVIEHESIGSKRAMAGLGRGAW
jgi:phage FluMu gp28-like protein